jgi:hypothetical protein
MKPAAIKGIKRYAHYAIRINIGYYGVSAFTPISRTGAHRSSR